MVALHCRHRLLLQAQAEVTRGAVLQTEKALQAVVAAVTAAVAEAKMAEKEVAETEAEKATVASVSARGTSAEHRVGQVVHESQQSGRRRFQSQ